jgi:hypothetical protein
VVCEGDQLYVTHGRQLGLVKSEELFWLNSVRTTSESWPGALGQLSGLCCRPYEGFAMPPRYFSMNFTKSGKVCAAPAVD